MARPKPALEIKGRMLSLSRVRVIEPEVAAIAAQLQNLARQMPQAVIGMPVLLEGDCGGHLHEILPLLRQLGMQPVAALDDGAITDEARACGLPVLPDDVVSEAPPAAAAAVAPEPPAAVPAPLRHAPARIVTEPVRSGQQLYAEGCDLVLLATVGAGAEVIADGCVHVYGRLRGRAIAGARGDASARIFARQMEAELVAVAGIYAVADKIDAALRGLAVQAWLDGDQLKLDRLEA
jgi:septum site-determining protein MinC